MHIRQARVEDAAEACLVLRRSITELCHADHHNDPAILTRWLASKTTANVAAWIANPAGRMLVAVEGDTILGVGGINAAGEITLNYVSPDARFRGVSKAMLARLEGIAVELGYDTCTVTSTAAARLMYLSAGYIEQGAPTTGFVTDASVRMIKRLPADRRPLG